MRHSGVIRVRWFHRAFAGWPPVFVQMFQKTLLVHRNLVEFIQVDKEKSSQGTLRFLFAAEVQAVGIAETQFGR